MFVFFEHCWGKFWKPYAAIFLFLGCRKKVGVSTFRVVLSSQSGFESKLQIFTFNSEFPVMAHTCTQRFGCVFCYFSFDFIPADTGDLWSKLNRLGLKTKCLSSYRTPCLKTKLAKGKP